MEQSKFPPGWNEERVKRVIAYYEAQTEEEAVAEDEAAFEEQLRDRLYTVWAVVRKGKIELLEPIELDEGQRMLVTLFSEPAEGVF